ncbi:MAG TPA: CAP domain-containing protein [Burkholderiales bacterium]|nr:CAP domain-containing protein [Burkholderiales bacterium]
MRLRIFSGLLLLAFCLDAAADDVYSAINRLRAGQGSCRVAERLHPLAPQPALERVARDLSQGANLQLSLKSVGYRAARASVLTIRGDGAGAQGAEFLQQFSYCEQTMDAGVTEIGVYAEADQLWIVLAAPFAPSVGVSEQSAGLRLLDLVNQVRAAPRYCGSKEFSAARPVRWNEALAEASRQHSEEMAHDNYFSHAGSDGSQPSDRVERAGYRWRATGENIAAGQKSADDAMSAWIKSPAHCANLMNPAFTDMGAAFAVDPGSEMGVYWTQAFGAPR